MNILQAGLACLLLVGFVSNASADSVTGKVTYYQTYTNANGDYYTVRVGPFTLSASKANGELLREAFFRKLTVSVNYTATSCFLSPPCGAVSAVSIQSVDLP